MTMDEARAEHDLRLLKGGDGAVPGDGRGHRRGALRGDAGDLHLRLQPFGAQRWPRRWSKPRSAASRCAWWSTAWAPARCPRTGAQRWAAAGVRWRIFNPAQGWRLLLPQALAAPAPQAVRGRRRGGFLRRHQPARRPPRPQPRRAGSSRGWTSRCACTGPLVADVHDTMRRLWWRLQAAREVRHGRSRGRACARCVPRARAGVDRRRATRAAGSAARWRRWCCATTCATAAASRAPTAWPSRRRGSEILIANAYFIPGVQLQRALLRAARRGVRITLLLQGRYEYFMQYHASRAVYGMLLDAGIEIIEYEASFLHAKVAVMDAPKGALATVGSSNLDPFSLLLAREANVFVRDDGFAAELRATCGTPSRTRAGASNPTCTAARPWSTRVLNWVAYGLMRFALLVTGTQVLTMVTRPTWSCSAPRACTARRATSSSTPGGRWTAPSSPTRMPTTRAAATATTWPPRRPKACCARGWATSRCRPLAYGEVIEHHGVRISLHPAGHVLGSAQVRLEHGGQVWVASGDYFVAGAGDDNRTCAPFEPVRCDCFITESTFGLPIYRWRAAARGVRRHQRLVARQRRAGPRERAAGLQLRQGAAHPGRRGRVDRADPRARRGRAAERGLPRRRRGAAGHAARHRGRATRPCCSARW